MSNTTVETVVMDIETAIKALENSLPTILGVVGVFYPGVKAVIPFLPFLQVAMNTLQQVDQVLNQGTPAAVKAMTDHLQAAPAQFNSPAQSSY